MGDMKQESPVNEFVSRLIGGSNESTISFCGVKSKALIDSGSMVTTVSESFLKSLCPQPVINSLDDFVLKGPDGRSLPYLGFIEAL